MTTSHEDYTALREKWVHEDDLINHRLSWMLLAQTILFATYGILLTIPQSASSVQLQRTEKLIHILPWIGIINVFLIYISIWAAISAQMEILEEAHKKTFVVHVPGGARSLLGHAAPIMTPIVFFVAWLIIIVA